MKLKLFFPLAPPLEGNLSPNPPLPSSIPFPSPKGIGDGEWGWRISSPKGRALGSASSPMGSAHSP